jgi:hypothetical protein
MTLSLAFSRVRVSGVDTKPVQWSMPNLLEERGEIARQAHEMGMDWRQVMLAVKRARLVPLDDRTWNDMENTDSNDPDLTLRNILSWPDRDAKSLLQVFQMGGALPAPIVLMDEDTPVCVAGNTRLSLCRVLGVRPKVLLIQV